MLAMKKALKRHFKKALSILLAMTFVLSSAATLTAFAVPAPTPSQIGDYYEYDQTGLGTVGYSSSQKTSGDGMVTVEKNISAVAGQEDVFDIELVVTTKESVSEVSMSKDMAVVLVIDVSSSMSYILPGSTMTRLAAAKDAASSFVDDYIQNAAGAKRMLSIVIFDRDAKTVLNWTNVGSDNVNTVKNTINNDVQNSNSGTNVEGGLRLAYNLLGLNGSGQPLEGITSVYAVLLSDGAPTAHISSSANRNSTTSIAGVFSGGTGNYASNIQPAEEVAEDIREIATLYSIAFASAGDTCYTYRQGSRTVTVTIGQWLTSISNGYYSADDADELAIEFEEIVEQINKISEAGTVTDPMGDYIVFDKDYNKNNNDFSLTDSTATAYFDTATKTVLWKVFETTPTVTEQGDDTYRTYRLSYRIKLDTVAIKEESLDGIVNEDRYYLTNKATSLTYQIVEDDEVTGTSTIYFRVPTVRGYFAHLYFSKVAAHNNGIKLAGATFKLYNDSLTMTATSNSYGIVSFGDIPAGD